MSGASWYFAKNNQQQGPVPEEELRKLLESKDLSGSALVWTQGMGNWLAAKEVEVFADIFAAPSVVAPPAPPPLPAAAEPVAAILSGSSEPAAKSNYAEGGFDVRPESFQFQQPGIDGDKHDDGQSSKSSPSGNGGDSSQTLSAEERSERLRKLVAETPTPSGNKWGDLDSIPTPGSGAGAAKDLKSELDAIPTPGLGALRDRKSKLDDMPTPDSHVSPDLISEAELEDMSSTGLGALRDLKSQLEAIPTPGSGSAAATDLKSELDAIPTPGSNRGSERPAEKGSLAAQLDSIPTPGSGRSSDIGSVSKGRLSSSQLDAIPTPGAGRLSDSQRARGREVTDPTTPDPRLTDSLVDALKAIPTPGTFKNATDTPAETDLLSQLNAIPTPGSGQPQSNATDDVVLKPRTGLGGSGKFRKLSQQNTEPPPSVVDTGSFVKGTGGSNVTRRTFSKLVPISRGKRPNASEIPKEGEIDFPRPWDRAWARWLDDQLYCMPTTFLLLMAGGAAFTGLADLVTMFFKNIGIIFVGFLLKLALEAVILGKFGTSIGKRCFNIHLKDESTGEPLGMGLAIRRTLWLTIFSGWIVGAIPIVGPLIAFGCCLWQYTELTTYGKSTWDTKLGIRYEHHKRDSKGTKILVAVIAVLVAAQVLYLTLAFTKAAKQIMNVTSGIEKQPDATTGGNNPTQQPVQPQAQPLPVQPQPTQTHAQHKHHRKQEQKQEPAN